MEAPDSVTRTYGQSSVLGWNLLSTNSILRTQITLASSVLSLCARLQFKSQSGSTSDHINSQVQFTCSGQIYIFIFITILFSLTFTSKHNVVISALLPIFHSSKRGKTKKTTVSPSSSFHFIPKLAQFQVCVSYEILKIKKLRH